MLDRGPYVIAAGMDESKQSVTKLTGSFVDLFDPDLKVATEVDLTPGSRHFMVDLDKFRGEVIASSGRLIKLSSDDHSWRGTLDGIEPSKAIVLLRSPRKPASVTVDGVALDDTSYDSATHLLWLRFANSSTPRIVQVSY